MSFGTQGVVTASEMLEPGKTNKAPNIHKQHN